MELRRCCMSAWVVFLSVGLVGCSALTQSTFSQPGAPGYAASAIEALHERTSPSFKKDGHFHTVHFVAGIAGMSGTPRQNALTCYSQAPDKMSRYNAVPVSFWGFFTPEYRKLVVNTLHSLHGGDAKAVQNRREKLKGLVREHFQRGEPDWKTGFLIHALGDSYAHVHGSLDAPIAYGELVGHGFALLHDPDDILLPENDRKYTAYVMALYEALADGKSNQPARDFIDALKQKLPELRQKSKDLSEFLTDQERLAGGNPMFVETCGAVFADLDPAEVEAFLKTTAVSLAAAAP